MIAPTRMNTLAVGAASHQAIEGSSVGMDLVMATSFHLQADAGFSATSQPEDCKPAYTRWGNPTVRNLEDRLAALEGGEDAVCFGSGMGAISGLILSLLSAGDQIVASNVCYAGVAEFLHDYVERFGIEVRLVDTSDPAAVAEACTPRTKLLYVETPANPILRLTDLEEMRRCADRCGALLAVDSTFATPIGIRPLELGADFVVHSLTKYVCGHGDALGGVVIGARDLIAPVRASARVHLGSVLSPMNAWLIERSLHSLPLRMARHQANALEVARFLQAHPAVEGLFYPGLESHPQHALAVRQMANFSGMVAFRARQPDRLKGRIMDEARLLNYALSLGKTKSLIVYVETAEVQEKSFRFPPAELAKYRDWAGDGIFRLSVGLEDVEDILDDLGRLLD